MTGLKKGKGGFQPFLVSDFSMMFFLWPMQSVLSHLDVCHVEDREVLHFYSLNVV